ncbi:MAG: hypothetical protein ACN6RD_11415 [Stenotrophomonas maltophilia]
MEDKHGGIWMFAPIAGEVVVAEHYRAGSERLERIVQHADGGVQVALLHKVADPQWQLPVWSVVTVARVASVAEAERHLATCAVRQR